MLASAALHRLTQLVLVAATGVVAIAVSLTVTAGAAAASVDPVVPVDAPDPHVIVVDGVHYLYSTQAWGQRVPVWSSTDLADWHLVGDAAPTRPRWAARNETWAPGAIAHRGRVLLYTAELHVASAPSRRCLAVAVADSPTGPFAPAERPLLCDKSVGGHIDPYPYRDRDGSLWLLYKDDLDVVGGAARLRAVRLDDTGTRVVGRPTTLLHGRPGWEGGYVENPAMVAVDGQLHLLYSANSWVTGRYATGHAVCDTPAGPCRVVSTDRPLLASRPGAQGPGGASVFVDADGRLEIAYHAWNQAIGYHAGGGRPTFVEPLSVHAGRLVVGDLAAATELDCPGTAGRDLTAWRGASGWRGLVARLYVAFFGRAADRAGLEYWAAVAPAERAAVPAAFAGSAEFAATYAGTDDAGFVGRVYCNVLDRPADPGGAVHWLGALRGGLARHQVVAAFAGSAELRSRTGTR